MLRLHDITIELGTAPPLITGLSFDIAAGTIRLVQGPSGSGKSTLLGIIGGTITPAVRWTGVVELNGRQLGELPAEKRQVGVIFQDALLFPHMSVGDNLAFGLAARHRHDRRARVEAALAIAGLAGFADRDPATLSGGQAARIALMRTMLAEPEALLMDEAFSALDPDLRRSFGGFVQDQVRQRNIPALLVSHDPSDADFADGTPIRLG